MRAIEFIKELVEPKELTVPAGQFTPADVAAKKRAMQASDAATGAYGFAHPDPEDPHMINKELYGPSELEYDAYYQYIKAASPYMGENPYFPRVYIVKLEKDPGGNIRPVYQMEKLYPGDILNRSKRGKLAMAHMFEKMFGIEESIVRWYYITDTLKAMLTGYGSYPKADPLLKQAVELIKKVKKSNSSFDYDVHEGNAMIRMSSMGPQLVITDPLYEMNFDSQVFRDR